MGESTGDEINLHENSYWKDLGDCMTSHKIPVLAKRSDWTTSKISSEVKGFGSLSVIKA